jgi:GTP-binding protein
VKSVAIVGRPNVGKSAFFNRLTETKRALVHDLPGVTRDRLYGKVDWLVNEFTLIDTGGLEPGTEDVIKQHIAAQVETAVEEASLILFMVDGKTGIHPLDEFIAEYLRKSRHCRIIVLVNKVDDIVHSNIMYDFYSLGFTDIRWTSATHGLNIGELLDDICEHINGIEAEEDALLEAQDAADAARYENSKSDSGVNSEEIETDDDATVVEYTYEDEEDEEFDNDGMSLKFVNMADDELKSDLEEEGFSYRCKDEPLAVAVVGRPNVGKSSLINYLLDEKRLIVDDQPGTTRGPVDVRFHYDDTELTFIDTAGIKRRKPTDSAIERISSAVARGAIKRSDICIQLIDASLGIVSQDKHIAGEIDEMRKACIIAVNKWDLVEDKEAARKRWEKELKTEFRFLPHATVVFMSVQSGKGVTGLMKRLQEVEEACKTIIPTGRLNEMLREAQLIHQPPARKAGKRLKIYYAIQVRNRPGTFAMVVNDPKLVHFSFERYIENALRRVADFTGVPLRFIYRPRKNRRPHRN